MPVKLLPTQAAETIIACFITSHFLRACGGVPMPPCNAPSHRSTDASLPASLTVHACGLCCTGSVNANVSTKSNPGLI